MRFFEHVIGPFLPLNSTFPMHLLSSPLPTVPESVPPVLSHPPNPHLERSFLYNASRRAFNSGLETLP